MTNNEQKPSRINVRDLDQNIFRPNNPNCTEVLDADNSLDPFVTVYTIVGQQDALDTDECPILHDVEQQLPSGPKIVKAETLKEAYAKKTFNGKRERYYIKMNNRGDLYDPYGLYEEWNQSRKRPTGEPVWRFREVSPRSFELYLSFLKTKNKAWLQNATRTVQ